MGRPRENVVRFAVGGPNRPRSTVWRLWTGKGTSDVYISARTLGGALKVSLHESGTWRYAFTADYGEQRASTGDEDRVIERWKRPPPINVITSAFMVVVRSGEIGLPRHPLPERAKKYSRNVTWVPPAPRGSATHFIVMYTEPDGPVPGDDVRFVSRFELPNRQTVSVMVHEQAISEEQQRQIEAGRQAIAEQMRLTLRAADRAALEPWLEPRGFLYGHNNLGTRFFIDISGSFLFEQAL